ncbi:hypothetical protein [Roseiterribacter gracilis]|uniref:3-keto-disaccharide hydrolase domain-containing protein n=1 Tax=Roseiterribacter gracilis TaxID=2812848 RepID=A0A8S8XF68_9PROT|nr:hypothetical protein TMPK1_28790 [Rhodospirillales bacterium TMPK1]
MRAGLLLAGVLISLNASAAPGIWTSTLTTTNDTEAVNITVSPGKLDGKAGLNVSRAPGTSGLLRLKAAPDFRDGTIELDIAGGLRPDASPTARAFIGVSFRVSPDASHFETIYLRPTNGRADDQVRRNHTTQYISTPDFDFDRLRKESPEKYESYVDLLPDHWTHMKIEIKGAEARLFVDGAKQPCLVVTDLKLGADAHGGIAVWVGPGTNGYVRDVKVRYR